MWDADFLKVRHRFREIGQSFEKEMPQCRKENRLPSGLWPALTEARLFEYGLRYQGEDGIFYLAAALEGLSYGVLDGGVTLTLEAHLGLSIATLEKYCQEAIKKHYLDRVIHHNQIIAFSASEPHGGSDVRHLNTLLVETQGEYLLRGSKWLATNGPIADLIITFCQMEATHELVAVLLEANWSGIEKKTIYPLGLQSSPLGQFIFHDVRIPATHILGKIGEGQQILNYAFIRERLLVPFCCVGSTERVLEEVFDYALQRKVGKGPIADYQYIRKRLTDIAVDLETTRAIAHMGLEIYKRGEEATMCASIGKYYAASRVINSCIEAIQIMGSYGLLEKSVGEQLLSAVGATIAGGTEEVHREEIFASLYHKYRERLRGHKG